MSLVIDTQKVVAVLLTDGWHTVKNNSFDVGMYEYVDKDGEVTPMGVLGYEFVEDRGAKLSGSVSAIIAVRHA